MKKDFNGKQLTPKANKVLLILNIVIFLAAAFVLVGSMRHDEMVIVVAMALVMLGAAGNTVMSWIRLKQK